MIAGVRLQVLLTYQGNDMLTAMQVVAEGNISDNEALKASGVRGFWMSMITFGVLAALSIGRLLLDMFVLQRFMLAWRAWLTDRLTGDWLDGKAYYRARFIDDTIDNPDQRIQSDIDIFTAGNGPLPNVPYYYTANHLLFGAIEAVASMVSFTAILWSLSSHAGHLRGRHSESAVLDRARLRPLRDRHRLLDRQTDHLAQLQQREVQRRVPLRAGAVARCGGGGRVLPR